MSLKEYVYQWKKIATQKFGTKRGLTYVSFIAPLVAASVASTAYKLGKKGYEKYKKTQKKKGGKKK